MKISELKAVIKDLPDDAEITLFVEVDGEIYDVDINTIIELNKGGVKRYFIHGESK